MPNPIRQQFSFPPFPAPANQPEPNPNPPEESTSMQAGPSEQRIASRKSWQAALLAQMTLPPEIQEKYWAEWDAWAKQPNQAHNEKREEAVVVIKRARTSRA